MKKLMLVFCSIVLVFSFSQVCSASTFTFEPTPVDMWDLDHYKYYTWGIDWNVPTGESIIGASLFFDDIRNWDSNPNDLWVTLLA